MQFYPEVHSALGQKYLSLILLDSCLENTIPGMNVLIQPVLPRLLGSHDTCPGKLPCPQLSCGSHARAKITLQIKNPSGMVTQACKPITLETKYRKYRFKASLCYKEKPCSEEQGVQNGLPSIFLLEFTDCSCIGLRNI